MEYEDMSYFKSFENNHNDLFVAEIQQNVKQFSKVPFGPLIQYMENVCLDVGHLANSFIVDNFSDMCLLKEIARKTNVTHPNIIIANFDCEKYDAAVHVGLDDLPNVVANMFLDYCNRPFNDTCGYGDGLQINEGSEQHASSLVDFINDFNPSESVEPLLSGDKNHDFSNRQASQADTNHISANIPSKAGHKASESYMTTQTDGIEGASTLLEILLNNPEDLEYEKKPSGIRSDAVFTLDSRKISIMSAKSDDNGSYKLNGGSRKFYLYHKASPHHAKEVHLEKDTRKWYINVRDGNKFFPKYLQASNIYELNRKYRINKSNPLQHLIVTVRNVEKEEYQPFYLVIYKWLGDKEAGNSMDFKMPRHGNAKNPAKPPYFRIDPTVHSNIENLVESGLSNDQIYVDLSKSNSSTVSENIMCPKIISNRKYIINQKEKLSDCKEIFSEAENIISQVRDKHSLLRKAIFSNNSYCTINYTDQMITDLKRFCLKGGSVLLIDTTFEIADGLWLTDTCYSNLSLVNAHDGVSPMFPGPSFWHFSKSRETYRRFALELVMVDPLLINMPKIGHDLDLAIAQGFKDVFLNTQSLWCTQHMKSADAQKLKTLGANESAKQRILADIYGSHQDVLMQSGLADSSDEGELDARLESLKSIWEDLVPGYYRFFKDHRLEKFKECLVYSSRSRLGITDRFTTNGLEVKHKLQKKKLNELSSSNDIVTVTNVLNLWTKDNYYLEAEKALRGIGKYRLSTEFENFFRDPLKWNRYSNQLQQEIVSQFLSFTPLSYDNYKKPKNAGKKTSISKRRVSEPEPEVFVDRTNSVTTATHQITPLKIKRSNPVDGWKVQQKERQENVELDRLLSPMKSPNKYYQLVHREDVKLCPKSVRRCEFCRVAFSPSDFLLVKTVGSREGIKKDGKQVNYIGNVYLHYADDCLTEYDKNYTINQVHVPKSTIGLLPKGSAKILEAKGMIID